jgi:ACS family tartrate transporter-like MFS transporter
VNERAIYRKITLHLIPYLFLLYIVAYVDRVNVGFAAMDIKRQLHYSDTVYGMGAGIFFLGSALFDLPSNLLLARVGARSWIARIMVSWGIISLCMIFMRSPLSFYVLRFLLGVCEAGFFPGIIFYLTYWFPSHHRARAVAKFMTATSIAGIVGGPLSGVLLRLDGWHGLAGWQWLFLAEGIPTILLGLSVLLVLKNRPADASWLQPEERDWLVQELQKDRDRFGATQHGALRDAFRLPMLWLLAGAYFVSQVGVYIVNLWMPLILNDFVVAGTRHNSSMVARYATLPYLAAAIFTVVVGWNSDRTKERRGHIAGCLLLAAAGFAWTATAHDATVAIMALCLAAMGLWSMMGPFWTLTTSVLEGTASAAAVAILTTIGGFGAFLGPFLTGRMHDATHNFSAGLYGMSGLALLACLLSLGARPPMNSDRPPLLQ